ncbi:long-chain fatty acid--CoA ligase [Seongchinamella sediminis]|uniref:Long-chain fatty acid--CoA ligase n=1 Tax=Seongchinamella sediminis TaxID=2283635 RepID=A0A3L7DY28_9GAMM|nr:class I adenylate-forming enzyme family protein [Seongchinamella sediminis]RLQ21093.1 long-chain fatty acid--CoA ligase [Seongchinamella sediminis]
MNVMMLLEMAAQGFGDRVAFTNGDDSLTYQELYDAAGAAAAEIRQSGCDYVAMLDVTSLAMPVALFACAWAGVPYVPINYRLTPHEIKALLERVEPCLLITEADRARDFSGHENVQVCTREDFLSRARSGEILAQPWSMDQEDTGVLLFTSGTTGAPKAAVLRQKHLVSYILGSVEFMSATEEEASLGCVPPYHIAGISAVLSSVYSGRRVVQLANFTAGDWIALVNREKVTNAFVVPTMLARIVDSLGDDPSASLPSLRALAYGGGKMPLAVIERAMQLLPNADFTNAYGLTETSSTIAVLGPQDHRDAAASEDQAVRRRLVSVGRPLPGVEVEIRDDEGRTLAAGERGEIYVRGEQVSGEYVGKGSLLDAEGWFPTRDAGSLDAEGFLFLEGRADDVIVRGGENMSPGEIEDVLLEHGAVSDVAVVGVPDEQWGEAVAAAVVVKTGQSVVAEELQNWVKERMRSSRVPQLVQFWDELPYNETGKLLRRTVKARLSA